jgi:hypothetical protein
VNKAQRERKYEKTKTLLCIDLFFKVKVRVIINVKRRREGSYSITPPFIHINPKVVEGFTQTTNKFYCLFWIIGNIILIFMWNAMKFKVLWVHTIVWKP